MVHGIDHERTIYGDVIQRAPKRALLSFAPASIANYPDPVGNGVSNLSAVASEYHDRSADFATIFNRKQQRRFVTESCERFGKVEMFRTAAGQDDGNDRFVICAQGCGRINYATPKHQTCRLQKHLFRLVALVEWH